MALSDEDEVKLLQQAGECPKGGPHTLGEVRAPERGGPQVRYCGKCGQRLWRVAEGWY